jgi:hypothetical protein
MIELGLHMLEMIEKLNVDQRAIGFEILRLINDRAEFDLGTLYRSWFQDHGSEDSDKYSTFRDMELVKEKIIEHFIIFNNNCLKFSLERLSRGKNIDKEAKMFVEFYLSVAYFRIPKFRSCFIEIISKDLEISEGDELEKGLTSIDDFINLDPVNSLILWDNLFYKRLESALQNNKIENEMNERMLDTDKINAKSELYIPGKVDWRERLGRRDLAFFSMVSKIEKYIQNKVVKAMDIKWYNIPGFNCIIDAICHELKIRDVRNYPIQLMDLIPLFVNNAIIANKFVMLCITTTK